MLVAWIPCIVDLRNQGISNSTVTSRGTPTYSSSEGKIGNGCYTTNTGDIIVPYNRLSTNKITITFWCKINGWIAWSDIFTMSGSKNRIEQTNTADRYQWYSDSNSLFTNSTSLGTISSNVWHFFTYTFDGTTSKLYVDNVLKASGTSSVTLTLAISGNLIAFGSRDDTTYCNASYNDIRIYDNCLSETEVKEISKGLVAHYTLGSVGAGFSIAAKYQLVPPLNKTVTTSGNVTYSNNGYAINVSGSVTNTNTYLLWTDNTLFIAGHKYYFKYVGDLSMLSKSSFGTSGYSNWSNSPHSGSKIATCNTTYSSKFCIAFGSTGNVSGTIYCSCYDLTAMFGAGNEPSASTVDTLFPFKFCPVDSGLPIYDSSGYSRNLTIIGNVSPADSVRYDKGIYMPNQNISSNYLTSGSVWSPSFITTGSISFWCKFNGLGSSGWLPFIGLDGSHYVMATSHGTGNFYHENSGSPTAIYRDGVAVSVPSDNENWHHYVITGINLSTWTTFKVNQYGTSWNSNMYISDLRLYNTVLSADDVKDLYNLGTSIS